MEKSTNIPLSFRKLQSHEAKKAEQLIRKAFNLDYRKACTKEGVQNFYEYCSSKAITDRMENSIFLVAESRNKLLAVLELQNGRHISLLFVDASFQGRGVGKRFIEHLIPLQYEESENQPLFTVNASPDSQGFYSQFGFSRVGALQQNDGIPYYFMIKKN